MKILITLYFLLAFQSLYSQWEATKWRSDPAITKIYSSEENIILYHLHDYLTVSNDFGNKWQRCDFESNFIDIPISCIAIKNSKYFAVSLGDFYFSEDKGKIWHKRSSGLPPSTYINAMEIIDDKIIIGTWYNGILISSDEGHTWLPKNNGIGLQSVYTLTILNNNIFASTGDSIFISSDMGESWNYRGNGLGEYGFFTKFAVTDNKIFAATSEDTFNGSRNDLYMSADNGQTWIKKNSSIFEKKYEYSIAIIEDRLYCGTTDSLFYSDDFGDTWISSSLIKNGKRGAENFAVSNGIIYASSGVQLYKSSDIGENWFPLRDSISYGDIYKLIPHKDEIYICVMPTETWQTYDDGLFVTTDKGESFIKKGIEDKWVLSVQFIDSIIFAGTNQGLFRSSDNGSTWVEKVNDVLKDKFAYSIYLNENKLMIPHSGGYFETSNLGDTWILKNDKLPKNQFNNCMLIEKDYMIAGLDSCIYISFNNGDTWENRSNGLPKIQLNVKHIIKVDNNIFIGTAFGVFISTDMGANWQSKNSGLPIRNLKHIHINALVSIDKYLFAAVSGDGIFKSSDYGNSWHYTNCDKFGNLVVTSLALNDGYIFASTAGPVPGTRGSGIYKAKLSDFGVINSVDNHTETQNYLYAYPPYPLPAVNEVRSLIYWDTSTDIENDEMTVYNIYGKKVAGKEGIRIDKLTNYSGNLVWDCSDVPSGIYLININHGTESRAVKVIVNK